MKRFTQQSALAIGVPALVLLAMHQRQAQVEGDEPKKPITIAADQIYTTCDEYSPKYLNYGDGHPAQQTFINFTASFRSGASNAFLVRGDDVVAAMKATYQIFGRSVSAGEAVHPDENTKSKRVWFGAFLGISGSSPAQWTVKSIEIDKVHIRLSYKRSNTGRVSTDIHEYLVLAPLENIAAGTYTLELFDTDEKDVTMMRKVVVK